MLHADSHKLLNNYFEMKNEVALMNVQVLLSCMNQEDMSIIEKANIQTDAIIINQADAFKKEVFRNGNSEINFLTFDERGIGLSRNNALMRATGDIVLFADDDIIYVDGYERLVLDEFQKNPNVDFIVFNVPSKNPQRPTAKIRRDGRVRWFNCLKYGTFQMAAKTDSLRKHNLYFSLLFGGGARYSSGEDSKFIYQAINSGLRVNASTQIIGSVSQKESTWFEGHTKRYFVDKGVLYRSLSPRLHVLYGLRFVLKHRKKFSTSFSMKDLLRFTILDSKQEYKYSSPKTKAS